MKEHEGKRQNQNDEWNPQILILLFPPKKKSTK